MANSMVHPQHILPVVRGVRSVRYKRLVEPVFGSLVFMDMVEVGMFLKMETAGKSRKGVQMGEVRE
jgi:hypothetical protein